MKIPVNLMLKKLDNCYDAEDDTNQFDLGVQYMMEKMITFPLVEAAGWKSYPIFKGLVPNDFKGGSLTWLSSSPLNDHEMYNHRK